MDTISKNPEKWLEFDFPARYTLNESNRGFLKRSAAGSPKGGCYPYYFCFSAKHGHPCDSETAADCARRCEEFYEKYIKEEEE
ncbi:MAG: hypothetical protein V1814_02285 [Candidatus Moraniibacteriota bacterium]